MAEAYGGDIPDVPDDVTIGQFVLDLPHPTRPAWCYDSRPWLIEEDTGREIRLDEVMLLPVLGAFPTIRSPYNLCNSFARAFVDFPTHCTRSGN